MSAHGNRPEAPGLPLPALVAQLRGRCEAIARLQGGAPHYLEELAVFREASAADGWFLDPPPPELGRAPDDEGNEHQVWFRPASATFLKVTWPDHFGMLVVHRHDEEPAASPVAYLERWQLHNELFGDSVSFLGAMDAPEGLRLVITQPAIAGSPASEEQIEAFFTDSGWRPFRIDGNLAFFDPERNLVVSDTHRGNLILMDDGTLAPIDFRVQRLTGPLIDIVRRLS